MCYSTSMATERKEQMPKTYPSEGPIGTKGKPPLVVLTADLKQFLSTRLEFTSTGVPTYEKVVRRIKACKETGQILTGVSYDILKRIYREENFVTAEKIADAILISEGGNGMLGNDIPLYRNPFIPEKQFVDSMRTELRKGWNEDLDGSWNNDEQLEYITSFPSITPP